MNGVDDSRNDRDTFLGEIHTPTEGAIALSIALWGNEFGPPEWHHDAACAHTSSELWFPLHDTNHARHRRAELCHSCPVATECATDNTTWHTTSPFAPTPRQHRSTEEKRAS